MISLKADTKIFLAMGATDMRKGFDGLCGVVSNALKMDAKVNRHSLYHDLFDLGIDAFGVGLDLTNGVLDKRRWRTYFDEHTSNGIVGVLSKYQNEVVNDFSAFNAIAAASFVAVHKGPKHNDARRLRSKFAPMANADWGVAFNVVAGLPYDPNSIEAFRDAHVLRGLDNDIIMAQRGWKLADHRLTWKLKGGDEQYIVLDYIVLRALQSIWE